MGVAPLPIGVGEKWPPTMTGLSIVPFDFRRLRRREGGEDGRLLFPFALQ